MIVRIKEERYYEVEVSDGPFEDVKQDLETDMGDGASATWYLNNVAEYVGRHLFIEDAENHGMAHDYTQIDVY